MTIFSFQKAREMVKHRKSSGITLLFVMSILAALSSISYLMFTMVFAQLQITGELSHSFIALYAADEAIEKTLYEDRVRPANLCGSFGPSCHTSGSASFNSPNAFYAGACSYVMLTKTDLGGGLAQNDLSVTGQSLCGANISRFVRRAFDLRYTGPAPGSNPPNPIGYWPFDESSGTTAADTSGVGNNGTLQNGPVWVAGRVNNALSFDGVNDVVNMGSPGVFDYPPNMAAFTLMAWINPATYGEGSRGRIFDKATGSGPVNGWAFLITNQTANSIQFIVDYATTDITRRSGAGTVPLTQWSHVAVTWDGSTNASNIHIYVNGVETTYSSTVNGAGARANDGSASVRVANDALGSRTFSGLIDDARVYDRVLSAGEISAIYSSFP